MHKSLIMHYQASILKAEPDDQVSVQGDGHSVVGIFGFANGHNYLNYLINQYRTTVTYIRLWSLLYWSR